jgi:prepilin-type N-terminal cleavage/methylation domain-containing protein
MRCKVANSSERGVTLLELMIAVTLVAALSAGMLMAMHTSLLTYQKVSQRLDSNRRVMRIEQILTRQLAAVMPVPAVCTTSGGGVVQSASFSGTENTLRLVSSFSIAEGAHGYPQIVEYQAAPAGDGSLRLVMTERPYTGPQSTALFCADPQSAPLPPPATTLVLAEHLASFRVSYHQPYDISRFVETAWLPLWDRPVLPAAVRIDMKPLTPDAGSLPLLGVTIPIRVDRDPRVPYVDGN